MVVLAVPAFLFAMAVYAAMSDFPVPGPEPVPPSTGPSDGDILVFVAIGAVGILGVGLIIVGEVCRRKRQAA